MRIIISTVLILFLAGCTAPAVRPVSVTPTPIVPVTQPTNQVVSVVNQVDHDVNSSVPINPPPVALPANVNLNVAFASQAPLGDWGLPYQEACEEASLILANIYFTNAPLDKNIMDAEILKLVAWEERQGIYPTDISAAEVVQVAKQYFRLKAEVSSDVSIENIKAQLAAGKIILAPFAGRLLGNPYYSGKGPIYHFQLIRGYDAKNFITNDVGTSHGDGYKYSYNTIINAIHDLPLNSDGTVFRPYDSTMADADKASFMLTGGKKIVILSK